jgi:Holliday junction resolvase RusA-like endonuclease
MTTLYNPKDDGYELALRIDLDENPKGKPRMTRRDKWKKRPSVMRWFAYKDEVKLKAGPFSLPLAGYWIIFTFKPPRSWTIKRTVEAFDTPHQQKPDKDNLEKGLMDIFMPDDDSKVYDGRVTKQWGVKRSIEIWWKDGAG